ncbi:C40 family peptidase [Caballeronia sp. dw_276]|jgi:cell wall-associated NlpC family hydrolase|uniref:C40 family peptidase n=1 Tax=Caballeronia sp. dw_276 TaxID=2719795 RepID=UPI001BD6B98A|nr:C40 family peptidase [Caballeronia sp. dw_276]
MRHTEITTIPSYAVRQGATEVRAGMSQRKTRSARLVATAFSSLILATASGAASASTTGLASLLTQVTALDMADSKHAAGGIIQVGNPVSLDGDALLYDPARYQDSPSQEQVVAEDMPSARLSDVLEKAETMIGVPYSWGGNTPEQGLDCSGFVRYVYQKAAGILLPRVSSQISRKGVAIAQTDLHPGDLVFFNTTRGTATHVGIYVGENQFIHAPKKGAYVRIESMKSAYWTRRYYGARRVA